MKTLDQLAKEFNLYRPDNIPAIYRNNDNFEHRIKIGHKEIPEFLTSLKGYEAGLYYECKQDTNYEGIVTYYVDHAHILLRENNSELVVMLMNNKGKFYFHPYYDILRKYNSISHYMRDETLKSLKEPNLIGSFTEKKVKDWLFYCHMYIIVLDSLYDSVNDKNQKIEEEIKAFCDSLPGAKISENRNVTYIETHLFSVRFEHIKEERYLKKDIRFNGDLSDIILITNELTTSI